MNTIPTRSKKIYEQAYGELMLWCRNKGIQTITEEVLLAFFTEKSISIKATTLLSKHSMLKNTLATNDNIDIRSYSKLNAFLKFKSDDYKPEPSNILSREQIDKFLKEAPDKTYLMIKVALIIGLAGACRREELAQLTIDDIQDYGSSLLITIKDPINDKQRSFVVGGSKQRSPNYYAICKKYARLRPPRTNHRRFFICYKKGRCSGEVVGKHVYGMLPRQIASYLEFQEYTKATAAVPKPIFIKTEN